jgi:hypothetical protein
MAISEAAWFRRFPGDGEHGLELQVGEPWHRDSAGTVGRRTCSAGLVRRPGPFASRM